MGYLGKIVAEYSDTLSEDINEALFDRRKGKQIYEFIIDDLKSVEMIPNVYLKNIEYITDPSKIDVRLNRRIVKNRKILKQKIEKLIPIHHTAFNALKFNLVINNRTIVENTILIPKYVDRYHLMINSNKTLVMFQIIDNSTYNLKGDVILKTRIPAKLSKDKYKIDLTDIVTNTNFSFKTILKIDLFKKKFNPLYYPIAKKGIIETIKFFGYQKLIDITESVRNSEVFHYFRINTTLLLEVEKTLFANDIVFRSFILSLFDVFNNRTKMEDIYNSDFWIKRLGSLFTTSSKNQYNKGLDVLKSFKNVLDITTQKTLCISNNDKDDIYSVMRWIIREFNELRNRDNNSLKNKRIRTNEYIAAYFGNIIKDKINYALNMKPFDEAKLSKVFKFDEYVLFKLLVGGTRACPLFRYNIDINDLQALNALKYSVTGIQGLPSLRTTDSQKDLYPSHLGILELNAISSSSPGISGQLTPFCKIYGTDHGYGYFAKQKLGQSNYENKLIKNINELKMNKTLYALITDNFNIATESHDKMRWLFKYKEFRNSNGMINIVSPEYGRSNGFIPVQPKLAYLPYCRSEAGFIKLTRKNNDRAKIKLKKVSTKIVFKSDNPNTIEFNN